MGQGAPARSAGLRDLAVLVEGLEPCALQALTQT